MRKWVWLLSLLILLFSPAIFAAQKAIVLANQYDDERTETSAREWWDDTILKALDKAQTCDQAMNAWRASSPLRVQTLLKLYN